MTPPEAASPQPGPVVQAYLTIRPNLVRFFAAKLRSVEAAEDLVQEIYIRALKASDAEVQDASAWLFRVGSNLLVDMQRGAARRLSRDNLWARETQPLDEPAAMAAPSQEDVLAGRQRLARVLSLVEAMPPRMAEAFRLHRLQGLPQSEVARRMGISTKAVEKHLAAVLHRLTEAMPDAAS